VVDERQLLLVFQLPRVLANGAVQEFADVLLFGLLRTARLDVLRYVVPVAEAIVLDSLQQFELF
jgi:hypothetical protein